MEFVPDQNGDPVYIGVGCCTDTDVCHRWVGASNNAGCFAGYYDHATNVLPDPKTWDQAVELCHNEGKELCAAPLSDGICHGVGCWYNVLYQWSTTECEPGDANYREGCETPTAAPTTYWDNKKKRKDDATLLIVIIVCVVAICACGCLSYASYVRPAKKKTPALSHPTTTTTTDPTRLHDVHGRMVGWYEAPAQAELRRRWGPFPLRPEELEAWPGFVPVTNVFMDVSSEVLPAVPSAPPLPPLPPPSAPPHFRYREAAEAECATPVAVQVTKPEVARPVAGTSTAPFATVVNV